MRAITPSHIRIFARKYALMHLREFKCATLCQSALEPVRIFEFNNTLSHSSEFKSLQAIKHYCIQVNSNLCAQPNAPEIEKIRRFARNHTCLLHASWTFVRIRIFARDHLFSDYTLESLRTIAHSFFERIRVFASDYILEFLRAIHLPTYK